MNLLRSSDRLLARGLAAAAAGVAADRDVGFRIDGAPPGADCS